MSDAEDWMAIFNSSANGNQEPLMDLSHWNTEPKFSLHEAACLIVGIDPLMTSPRNVEAEGRRALVERQLEADYRREVEDLINEFDARIKAGRGGHVTDRIASTFGIRSIDCECTISMSTGEEPPYHFALPEFLRSQCLPIEHQQFGREQLSDWCRKRGWNSKFDFAAAPAWKTKLQSTPVSVPHPRTEKNYLALIAVMAIDKYGYDSDAKKSNVPSELAIALRARGFNLTDEAIRGYLKEGGGHLNPKFAR